MTAGVDLLREFWRLGVVVELAADRFRLRPAGVAPDKLRETLREYRPEVSAILEQLPAPGRCPLCGTETGHPDKQQLRCTHCALIAAERRRNGSPDISTAARNEVAA